MNFQPFAPDYKSSNTMQVISNLQNAKDCEFDHAYILNHLEQLEIDPTLYSKFSVASKYFKSLEPFAQELYKKSCHWQKITRS